MEESINRMADKIEKLRSLAEELMLEGGDIQAVKCNLKRLMASLKMLELNVVDITFRNDNGF